MVASKKIKLSGLAAPFFFSLIHCAHSYHSLVLLVQILALPLGSLLVSHFLAPQIPL